MIDIVFVCVFDTKVVDYKGEEVPGVVEEEAFGVWVCVPLDCEHLCFVAPRGPCVT